MSLLNCVHVYYTSIMYTQYIFCYTHIFIVKHTQEYIYRIYIYICCLYTNTHIHTKNHQNYSTCVRISCSGTSQEGREEADRKQMLKTRMCSTIHKVKKLHDGRNKTQEKDVQEGNMLNYENVKLIGNIKFPL